MVAFEYALDQTLDAADRALETRYAARWQPRDYLGASYIGETCHRRVWFDFRWAASEQMSALAIKRIEDGFCGEDVQADRLRMIDGVDLITLDPDTGRQIGFSDFDDHFRGHADGVIIGILEAPRTWHVWEHKVSEKLPELEKLRCEVGEKNALAEWNSTYYAQAQVLMHKLGIDRHFLTVSPPGSRAGAISVRTEYDAASALQYCGLADRLIRANEPPARVSEKPEFYLCSWCKHSRHCHSGSDSEDARPDRNCRTCMFSSPVASGCWHCERFDCQIDRARQLTGCEGHRFIPALINGQQADAASDGSWIRYDISGTEWHDEGPEVAA